MMFIDDNRYVEYNMKEVQKTYMPTRAELVRISYGRKTIL